MHISLLIHPIIPKSQQINEIEWLEFTVFDSWKI